MSDPSASLTSPRRRALAPALVAAAALWGAWPSLGADFLADDFGYLRLFHELPLAESLRPADISRGIWGRPLDEMRPAFALSYAVSVRLFGTDGTGHHALNLALHAACAVLVYAAIRLLAPRGPGTAVLGGLLFAFAPVHAEPIAWITGRVDLIPTAFYLAAVASFLRFRREEGRWPWHGLSLLAFAAGLLSKEILLTLPVLLVLLDLPFRAAGTPFRRWSSHLRVHAPYWVVALVYVAGRYAVVGNVARAGGLRWRLVRRFLGRQAERLPEVFLPTQETVAIALAAVVVLACGAALVADGRLRRSALPGVAIGLAWYGVTLAPLVVTYPSVRHLYLPSCGAAVALAFLILPPETGGRQRLLRLLAAALAVALSAQTLRAGLGDWAEAGATSAGARREIERLAPVLSRETAVVLTGVPAFQGRAYVWSWALPFALERPFTETDVYQRLRLLEPPGVYCCPTSVWWPSKKPILEALLNGSGPEVRVAVLQWDPVRRSMDLRHRTVAREALARQVEEVLGAPLGDVRAVDERAAARLLATLAGRRPLRGRR